MQRIIARMVAFGLIGLATADIGTTLASPPARGRAEAAQHRLHPGG